MIEKITINSIYLEKIDKIFLNFKKDIIISDLNNNEFTNYYIYIINNDIVGIINYYNMYERSELIQINVVDSYKRKKIASKLMEYMFNDLIKKGVKSITLEVKENNIAAINLYKKYGFKKINIRKGYYQGIDAILMEKELV